MKSLTHSNVAILIPDSFEVVLSQQMSQDPRPVESLAESGGPLPLSEGVTHREFSPMKRPSTPVDTDCHDAKCSNHPEENSPFQATPAAATPSRSEPCWHPNTNHEVKEWNLNVIKPVLIVGDSNLSRIPSFTRSQDWKNYSHTKRWGKSFFRWASTTVWNSCYLRP